MLESRRDSVTQRVVAAVFLTACAAAAVACSPSSPAATPVATTAPVARASSAVPASGPDHVVIVMLENKNEADVLHEGPYLASLAASGATLTDMHAETHPSQPNYLALFSGDTQGVDDDRRVTRFAARHAQHRRLRRRRAR